MQPRSVRILDFDSSLTKQQNLIQRFNSSITDLRQIGPHCRLWMNAATAEKIKRSLDPSLKASATFLGSGDFHHISSLLIRQFDEPISVIIFDHHPDWDILPPKFGCGSWASRILEMPNVRKVILLGVSSEDISGSGIKTANLAALKENRLEIYPYIHPPTKVFLRPVPENISFELRRHLLHSSIIWQELQNKNLKDFCETNNVLMEYEILNKKGNKLNDIGHLNNNGNFLLGELYYKIFIKYKERNEKI